MKVVTFSHVLLISLQDGRIKVGTASRRIQARASRILEFAKECTSFQEILKLSLVSNPIIIMLTSQTRVGKDELFYTRAIFNIPG